MMLAYEKSSGFNGELAARYKIRYHAPPKQQSISRDSVISITTTNSSVATRSRYARSSNASSKGSIQSVSTDASDRGKKYRFDTAPTLVKTPWEADRSKRTFSRQWQQDPVSNILRPATAKSTILSAHVFKRLPREVYDCIVKQLCLNHFSHPHGVCISCYLSDLFNLCLVNKSFEIATRHKLYEKLWLLTDDISPNQAKGVLFPRMKQLRRTLRLRPSLAMLPKELNIVGLMSIYKTLAYSDQQSTISILASLVMAVPNMEHFSGFQMTFDHDYDRLTHALATRRKLKAKTWVLKEIEENYNVNGQLVTNARTVQYDGSIANGDAFLNSHHLWQNLETLILFGKDTGNLDYRAFVATFRTLSSLKNLLISGFDKKQFNDRTVSALPLDLRSLRLQNLPGVTERGLMRLVESTSLNSMRSLSLIGLEISSSHLIATLFKSAPRLQRFTLIQSISPTSPGLIASPAPSYSSNRLQFLHWDVSPFSQPSVDHIALAIKGGGFPALRTVRVPCDDGTIQALCKPRAQIARTSDMQASSSLSLRSSLAIARMMAQERLEEARQLPFMRVVVTDEEGVVQHKYTIKNYLGDITSKIEYLLEGHPAHGADDCGVLELDALVNQTSSPGSVPLSSRADLWCSPVHQDTTSALGTQKKESKFTTFHKPRERIRHVDTHAFF